MVSLGILKKYDTVYRNCEYIGITEKVLLMYGVEFDIREVQISLLIPLPLP